MSSAIGETAKLLSEILAVISSQSSLSLFSKSQLTWDNAKFADSIFNESFLSDLFGMLEVDVKENGIPLQNIPFAKLPPKEAIEFFKSKDLIDPFSFEQLADKYKYKSFSIAGVYEDYVLEETFDLLSTAISEGKTRQWFIKELNSKFDKLGLTRLNKHYLETMFQNNVLGSYNHGRYVQQQRSIEKRPFWQYVTIGDNRVRPDHAAMDGRIFAANDPIWEVWYPPNGHRCRCMVVSLGADEAVDVQDRLPEIDGRMVEPDKGWNTSPKDWI